ncbi:hypothetical protein GCM10008027_28300 [Pseudoalteromonas gelatinilytica]|uniref:Uncharacterized protein n=1 Tax=Pseudoalteromonas gelatinilytica TaxID=1703256 RepID=A0ABQ1TUP5_9GAMM|nr:hypothetical protein GCM10008027_28300 [Pseudoalteromonas profundi]
MLIQAINSQRRLKPYFYSQSAKVCGNVGFSSDYDKPQKTLVGGLKMGCVTSILILAHYFNPLI